MDARGKNDTAPERPVPRNIPAQESGITDRIHAYFMNHAQTLVASLGQITRIPLSSTMTILVIAVALSLPAGFFLLLDNLQQLSGNVASSNRVSLFLDVELGDDVGAELADRLRKQGDYAEVTLIRKQQAMDEFRQYSGFGEVLDSFGFNPLPVVIQLQPSAGDDGPEAMQQLQKKLAELPEVDFVQLDMQWLKRLSSLMEIADRAVSMLSVLLAAAVLFIIGNTIRLELHNRREEIVIAKLLGATDGFIRRPFVYSGFWYGLIGGLIAWVIVCLMILVLKGPVQQLSSLYENAFSISFMGFADTLFLWFFAALLGVLAAWSTVTFHLQKLNPE